MAKEFFADELDKTDMIKLNQYVDAAAEYKVKQKLAGQAATEQAKLAKEEFGIPTKDFNAMVKNRNDKNVDEEGQRKVELAALEERLYDAGKANRTAMG